MWPTNQKQNNGSSEIDPVEEAAEESFPASDPPAWTPITSLGPPARTPTGVDEARGRWTSSVIGLLTAGLGVALMVWPDVSAPARLLGAFAIIAGVSMIAPVTGARRWFRRTEPMSSPDSLRRSATDGVSDITAAEEIPR